MGSSKIRQTVIVVDDDLKVLHQLSALLEPHHAVWTTSDIRRALAWLEKDPAVSAIMVEQMLRGGFGVDLLKSAKMLRPEVKRVLVTHYTDLAGIVEGLHSGTIHRIISKPILPGEVAAALLPLTDLRARA